MSVKIIAEIGVNHDGSVDKARELIDAAVDCGADAAKFQTFSAQRLASRSTPKVGYQKRSGSHNETHFEMLKKLELSEMDHLVLQDYSNKKKIEFCSTPYSKQDAEFLQSIGVPFFKVASADLIDRPLHEFLSSTGKPCLISVGMSTLGEIEETLNIYDQQGTRSLVTLLHCVSAYPSSVSSQNLKVLNTLKNAFGCAVGFSDHTENHISAVLSLGFDATVLERHLTLDRNSPGPDHACSSDPQQFREYVRFIRQAEEALGSPIKRVHPSELDMRSVSRKSICFAKDLRPGHVLSQSDLVLKRPGTGISPMELPKVIGSKVTHAVTENQQLSMRIIEPLE
jgi:N,N'-diacetyllegionaminate synthase